MPDHQSYPFINPTYVFSDIEESSRVTKRLEQSEGVGVYEAKLRNPYLGRVDELFKQNNGHLTQLVGDGHLIVFQYAKDALSFAVALQQSLSSDPIVHGTGDAAATIRVRLGVHTAVSQREPHRMENDLAAIEYPGSDTNFASRIMSLGAGGQIIVSAETHRATSGLAGYVTHPWSNRFLKSFDEEAHTVHEVLYYQDQEPREPGIRFFPSFYEGERNRYIDRTSKEAKVFEQFSNKRKDGTSSRLVTIMAEGGMGKTRLAIACAVKMIGMFEGGAHFINLARISSPAPTREMVAEAIGRGMEPPIGHTHSEDVFKSLKARGDNRTLLILDNYESTQSDDVARFLSGLVTQTRGVYLLVTGRKAVGVSDVEQWVSLDGGMSEAEARELFVARARLKKGPDWRPAENEERHLARILRLTSVNPEVADVNAIPLAVELAAAWVRFPLKKIADELEATPLGRMTEPVPGSVRADDEETGERHRSLNRSFEWSYNLLGNHEGTEVQQVFAACGLFAGSFDAEAVGKISALDAAEDALLLLENASLVRSVETQSGDVRYRMHRFIHQYAQKKQEDFVGSLSPEERSKMQQRQAEYFLRLAEETVPFLKGPDPENRVDRLEAEVQNLNQALEWCGENDISLGLRVATDLWQFWWVRGHAKMGMERILFLLSKTDKSFPGWAEAASVAGHLARHIGEHSQAEGLYAESLEASKGNNNPSGAARVLRHLGVLAWHQRRWEDARSFLDEALIESEKPEDIAEAHYELGNLARYQGKYEEAAQHIKDSLGFFEAKDKRWTATAFLALGNVTVRLQNMDDARSYYAKSLKLFQEIKDKGRLALIFERIAAVAQLRDRPREAAVLIGAAEKLRREIGTPLPGPDREEYYDQLTADLEQALGPDYGAQRERGSLLSLDEAIKVAADEVEQQQAG